MVSLQLVSWLVFWYYGRWNVVVIVVMVVVAVMVLWEVVRF